MLILSHRIGDTTFITLPDGTEIQVRLMMIDHKRARIGFKGPPHIAIDRAVIHKRKLAERKAAENT